MSINKVQWLFDYHKKTPNHPIFDVLEMTAIFQQRSQQIIAGKVCVFLSIGLMCLEAIIYFQLEGEVRYVLLFITPILAAQVLFIAVGLFDSSEMLKKIRVKLTKLMPLCDRDFKNLVKDVDFWQTLSKLPQKDHPQILHKRVDLMVKKRIHATKVKELKADIAKYREILCQPEHESDGIPIGKQNDLTLLEKEYNELKQLYLQKLNACDSFS